jgi:hypothetical protein
MQSEECQRLYEHETENHSCANPAIAFLPMATVAPITGGCWMPDPEISLLE